MHKSPKETRSYKVCKENPYTYHHLKKNNQKPKFPDGFWNILRPEISLEEALKDVTRINFKKALKDKKNGKEIIIHSPKETLHHE